MALRRRDTDALASSESDKCTVSSSIYISLSEGCDFVVRGKEFRVIWENGKLFRGGKRREFKEKVNVLPKRLSRVEECQIICACFWKILFVINLSG